MGSSRRQAFTLIELLAVMAIMMVIAGIAVVGGIGITRGVAMRTAVSHMRSTLMLARQAALTMGRQTYVIFDEEGYYVCAKGGQATGWIGNNWLVDEFANWEGVFAVGSLIFNLSTEQSSDVAEVGLDTTTGRWRLRTKEAIWQTGHDPYGWEINAKTYLPRGFFFGNGSPTVPDTVIFNGDGTTDNTDHVIEMYEEIKPGYVAKVRVKALTGFIEVEMP